MANSDLPSFKKLINAPKAVVSEIGPWAEIQNWMAINMPSFMSSFVSSQDPVNVSYYKLLDAVVRYAMENGEVQIALHRCADATNGQLQVDYFVSQFKHYLTKCVSTFWSSYRPDELTP